LLTQLHELLKRGGLIGALAGHEFVQDEAQRIEVALEGDLLPRKLFRRHVHGRAGPDFRALNRFRDPRQPEIRDAHLTLPVQHHVCGFQVAVNHASVVRRGKARADLARDFNRLVGGEASNPPYQRAEVFAVNIFHREVGHPFGFADVENAANIRVRNMPCQANLRMETLQCGRVMGERLGQELDGDGLAELQIIGPVDFAHPASSRQGNNAVTARKDCPGSEAPAANRAGAAQKRRAGRRGFGRT
jgi:hypothetical protein